MFPASMMLEITIAVELQRVFYTPAGQFTDAIPKLRAASTRLAHPPGLFNQVTLHLAELASQFRLICTVGRSVLIRVQNHGGGNDAVLLERMHHIVGTARIDVESSVGSVSRATRRSHLAATPSQLNCQRITHHTTPTKHPLRSVCLVSCLSCVLSDFLCLSVFLL